ncbi:MAG: glycosyl transferase [Acidobacteriaceae bacterium]|nr:glycosyl transferase [Acidobacteriaceae bacterium]
MDTTSVRNISTLQFFTIVAQNYLAYAFVLGESVLRYHPESTFSIFIMDDPEHKWQSSIEAKGFNVIYPEHISPLNYRKLVFQYSLTEATTSVKPSIFQLLFQSNAEKVIYLDPDILCFRRFEEVLVAFDQHSVVLTPHICSPIPEGYFPDDKEIMGAGIFNLGFIALKRSAFVNDFLTWWGGHLKTECLAEGDAGFFLDQKWVGMVPAFSEEVLIFRNPAYNVAYWNLHERTLEQRGHICFLAHSDLPLAFFHFSGFSVDNLDCICKYAARNPFSFTAKKTRYTLTDRPDLAPVFRQYRDLLLSADIHDFMKIPYGYAAYENGETISLLERSLYLSSTTWRESHSDPFATGPGSFRNVCRDAGVKAPKDGDGKLSTGELAERYGFYMRLIRSMLVWSLRLLGPEKYMQFAKYMRHQFLPLNQGFILEGKHAPNSPPSLYPKVQVGKSGTAAFGNVE